MSAPEAGASSVLNDEEALLVRCIAIRAAYGGMAGDVAMLRDFASLWTTRSATTASVPTQDHTACATKLAVARLWYIGHVASIRHVPKSLPVTR